MEDVQAGVYRHWEVLPIEGLVPYVLCPPMLFDRFVKFAICIPVGADFWTSTASTTYVMIVTLALPQSD
jgi:hypothetical protein